MYSEQSLMQFLFDSAAAVACCVMDPMSFSQKLHFMALNFFWRECGIVLIVAATSLVYHVTFEINLKEQEFEHVNENKNENKIKKEHTHTHMQQTISI